MSGGANEEKGSRFFGLLRRGAILHVSFIPVPAGSSGTLVVLGYDTTSPTITVTTSGSPRRKTGAGAAPRIEVLWVKPDFLGINI